MTNDALFKNWQQFATFPCKRNSKKPATEHGFKDAQFGQDVVDMLVKGYNIALALSTSNLFALDLDYHDEKSSADKELKELETKLGPLPLTLTQSTSTGKGKHLIFSSKGITSPHRNLSPNVETKFRGYIMIAPSTINGRQYEIIDGVDDNGNFIIAELSQAWLDYINKDVPTSPTSTQKGEFKEVARKVYKNIDVEKMFNNCAFLRYCRDNADCLKEPEWHSMITVLAQIEDSDELIHELSEPYPKYSYAETQKKIEYARAFGHSQTCTFLSENYPNICSNCISAAKKVGV